MAKVDAFLKLAREQGCSDIHLAVGMPPMLRMHGDLLPIKFRELGDTELEGYIQEILTESQLERFQAGEDLDFAYSAEGVGRFRINLFRKLSGIGATCRHIPDEVPDLNSLELPRVVSRMTEHQNGLVLVTGSTGTGKSTTLAAMVDRLNAQRRANIITLEDPVEFVHESRSSQVIQRELGTHMPSFPAGLRDALREDPDVVLVGELRDPETIEMAMTAAETGHLVFGTLHTTSAVKSIDRIIDALPAEQRGQVKAFLAQNLRAVVTQVLVKKPEGRGRKAIVETLVMNHAIGNLVLQDKTFQIPSQMQTGQRSGMQLLDQALLEAIQAQEIDPDDAYQYATDKQQFQRYVTDTSLLPKVDLAGG